MKIKGNIRVVKSTAATEVFVTAREPYINFAIHLPPDAEVKDGDSIEFEQEIIKQLTEAEAKKRAAELPGQIEPAAG
jgi:uncharacterized Zn finger protein